MYVRPSIGINFQDANQLRLIGFSPLMLLNAGFSELDVITAGYTAMELKASGFPPDALRAAGVTNRALNAVGYRFEHQMEIILSLFEEAQGPQWRNAEGFTELAEAIHASNADFPLSPGHPNKTSFSFGPLSPIRDKSRTPGASPSMNALRSRALSQPATVSIDLAAKRLHGVSIDAEKREVTAILLNANFLRGM